MNGGLVKLLRKYGYCFVLLLSTQVAFSQVIQAKIVDSENGKPVPFASVGIVGTWRGTSTNHDGEFSLAVTQPATIRITCIGYESLTIAADALPTEIRLKPTATLMNEVVILAEAPNPRSIVRKAFANIPKNFSRQDFMQKFFYRHYCRDDSVYGRLIEAYVEVWKHNGYRLTRSTAGEREEIRITQLRRSRDNTVMAQGHEPIAVNNILQADVIGYQTQDESNYPRFYDPSSNLRTDFEKYHFSLKGVSVYDGQQVYEIAYTSREDSIETTRGFLPAPSANGSLFITLGDFALLKANDIRRDGDHEITTSAYYQRHDAFYFPYHFIREGKSTLPGNHHHFFHIDLMSVDIQHALPPGFTATAFDKTALSAIPYDSSFWSTSTVLKATPLEEAIIHDLGGGESLNKQFQHYRQHEWATSSGGENAPEKFAWLRRDNRNRQPILAGFFPYDCRSYLKELEAFKKVNQAFRGSVLFVLFVTDDDEARWAQTNSQLNLFSDGMISYRLAKSSRLVQELGIRKAPQFILLHPDGSTSLWEANSLSDLSLQKALNDLTAHPKP